RFYIGSTGNLEDRIARHNQNRSLATKSKGPWKLIYSHGFPSRSEAVIMEMKIKNYGARRFLDEMTLSG
ncbi:MAG TPA: GIY-YIG nuclease family protein, partial [Bacteroidales bacterium]|nr:GIY-YIG nuclease family protein [Bacteroidales bacterium]